MLKFQKLLLEEESDLYHINRSSNQVHFPSDIYFMLLNRNMLGDLVYTLLLHITFYEMKTN